MYVAGHARVIDCFPDDFEIPAIVVYAYSKSPKFVSIVIDDEKGGYDMTRYLISRGHRKIGVIAGTPDNLHTRKRIFGLQKALYEEKIPFNPDWIRYGDWKRKSGYRETEGLIREGVTAIFSFNDDMAAGVYDYLYEHNITAGKDISVAGFDNREIAGYLKPGLTTNEIPFSEIGIKAAELLIKELTEGYEAKPGSEIIKMPCNIIERDSVKKIG
jgi:LacI family transcriptional regulator